MKKIKYLTIIIIAFFSFKITSYAVGTASLSVSASSIVVGNSVTAYVSIKNTAAWNILITSSGATTGCNQRFVGDSGTGNNTNQTFSVTCKSTTTGIINFTINGDITISNGTNTNVNGSKSVIVTAPIPKSTNNNLKELSIDGVELNPTFNKDTLEYNIELEPNTEKIKINAQVEDSKSTITGTGEITVTEGENKLEVVVTAQNGNQKTYVINAKVKELSPIEVTIDGKKYTVVRKKEALTMPSTYQETTITLNEEEIPAFTSDITKYTLIGLKDEEGNINLYIYNSEKNTYTLYNELSLNKVILYPIENNIKIPKGYIKTETTINNIKITGYQYKKGSEFILIYGMNIETGKEDLYVYDEKEKTLQRYNSDEIQIKDKEINNFLYLLIGVSSLSLLLIIIIIIITVNFNKNIKKLKQLSFKNDIDSFN